MKKVIFIIVGMLCVPYFALASVRVNEIAWMGTSASANNEWIELYNEGDASADISGFTLFADGVKKLSVPLSGTVAAKSFFLLERTNDDAVSGIVADQIYTGVLGNSGEILILKDDSGVELQKIDASAGWQAGDNTTKDTMQWSDGAWITAAPTPKAQNSQNDSSGAVSKTESDTSTTFVSGDSVNQTSGQNSSNGGSSEGISAHLSPLPLSEFSEHQEIRISAGRDRIIPAGGVLPFEAYAVDTKGKKAEGVSFSWSFGDGGRESGVKLSHAYEYPGNYIVVLRATLGSASAISRTNIRVFSPDIALSFHGTGIALLNRSSDELNITGWSLREGGASYAFAEDTIVAPKKEIVFSSNITKLPVKEKNDVELLSPNGKIVARISLPIFHEQKSEIVATANIGTSTLSNIKTALDRVAADAENIRGQLPAPTIPIAPKRNIASYQYATAVDLVKETAKQATSSDERSHFITLKRPEGFFAKLWHFFF